MAVAFPASMYNPVMYLAKNSIDIAISPVPLKESEIEFIQELRLYAQREKAFFADKELYIIRNVSKKGIGFFEEAGFYPPTKHLEMTNKHIPKTDWNARNVIFMEDSDYIDQLFSKVH